MNTFLRALAASMVLLLFSGQAIPGDRLDSSRIDDQKRRGIASLGPQSAPDEILVTCREGLTDLDCRESLSAAGHTVLRRFHFASNPHAKQNRRYLVRIQPGLSLEEALEVVLQLPEVEEAQPNYLYRALLPPDDTYFDLQWGLENVGDNSAYTAFDLRGPDPRVPGADMDVVGAHDLISGMTPAPVIVAVIDTGVDWNHEDLAEIVWTNPGEVPGDGVDNDGNGYVDDIHGWDFVNGDNDPNDEEGHGTHVAGVIGAVTDNGTGVAGVAPNARLMPLRFLDSSGSGYTDDLIDAIAYGVDNGARVLNNSWGGGEYDSALEDAIIEARDAGVLFIAAAGNEGSDNDVTPHYPSSYDIDNVVSVGASTAWGDAAEFSNWGLDTVHIAAPGDEIISTTPTGGSDGIPEINYQIAYPAGYDYPAPWSGTSMAAPAVSGAAAILFGLGDTLWPGTWPILSPTEQMTAVKDRILDRSSRWAAFSGTTVTEGHLNLYNLVEDDVTPPDPCGPSLEVVTTGQGFVTLRWMASGDDGSAGSANYYDLRYQQGITIDFPTATQVEGVWTPGPAGFIETFTIAGLLPDTNYTVGLEVVDNAGNRSIRTDLTMTTKATANPPDSMLLFQDAFDGDDCSNWLLAGDWGCESSSLSDSPGSDYPFNNRASAQLVLPLSFEGTQAVEVSFEFTGFVYEEGWDFLFFEYSLDGVNWRRLGRFSGDQSGVHFFDLSLLAGAPAVHFRFVSLSDYGISEAGAAIDNFQVHVTELDGCSGDADCDDSDLCNGLETCNTGTGTCEVGTPLDCDDGNLCTTDSCDPATGCQNIAPLPPGEVLSLMMDEAVLSWDPEALATGYDIVQGDLATLVNSAGDFSLATTSCLDDDRPETSLSNSETPSAGHGFWILVRGMNCGGNGSYDTGSLSQVGFRDAEINLSLDSCP